jgi:hypothetical protein
MGSDDPSEERSSTVLHAFHFLFVVWAESSQNIVQLTDAAFSRGDTVLLHFDEF